MKIGRILAVLVAGVTVALIVAGTLWPNPSALAFAGGDNVLHTPSTPEAAAGNLAQSIGHQDWGRAYSSLSNKAEFTEQAVCARLDRILSKPAHLCDSAELRTAAAARHRK